MRAKISVMILLLFLTVIIISSSSTPRAEAYTTHTFMTGAWLGSLPSAYKNNIAYHNQLTGHQNKIIHTFVSTSQDISEWRSAIDYVHSQGALNLLTIEPRVNAYSDFSTVDINLGLLDDYFSDLAEELKNWQGDAEIWLRPMPEVNGNWSGWSVGDSEVNNSYKYMKAFQRIVDIFRARGAYNVKFVYNVTWQNAGEGASYTEAYPGDDYVDYLSIDGYNWGTTQDWSEWLSFREIFDEAYTALTNCSQRPVIISEFASAENGGDKAAWITDASNQILAGVYPRLIGLVWFNENKETDWTVHSSESALNSFKIMAKTLALHQINQ